MKKIEKRIDDRRSAKVEWDEYGCHLHTMNNGFQWSAAAIYDLEVAIKAHEVLGEYIKMVESDGASDVAEDQVTQSTTAEDIVKLLEEYKSFIFNEVFSWEFKYDQTFGGYNGAFSNLGVIPSYCDPDMDYKDDVMAYYKAVEEYIYEN